MLQHPVTSENKSSKTQIIQTLKALKLSKIPCFIIYQTMILDIWKLSEK